MKKYTVRITVVRKADYRDLSARYELPLEEPCAMLEGQTFLFEDGKPQGLCESAWESMAPFAEALARGEGNFFGKWMKDPFSAMISCNDGFRPVSFLLERAEEEK